MANGQVTIPADHYIAALITQRNNAYTEAAQMSAVITGLQERIAELEKQLAEAIKTTSENAP